MTALGTIVSKRNIQESAWYIAITNPNCHRRAEGGLADLGYPAFWPKLRKWVSHARTKVPKEYPILGRYLFVDVPDGNFWAVRNVNGIEGLITDQDGAPAEIPERIVWQFRERYMRGEWDMVASNPVPVGARIQIMEGEFADFLTTVRRRHRGKLEFLANGKFYQTHESNVRAA
jgi:transcription antitermination factor NusG